jgi:protoporphyrinogen oxidase
MIAQNRATNPHLDSLDLSAKPLPRVVVLGAGPAGLGAAYKLLRNQSACVTVLERNNWVGGNSASFELDGVPVDFGSHRLHPRCDPEILRDMSNLLGDDLLLRPRQGRIRMRGRWIRFPLKPVDLAFRLPPSFAFGVGFDAVSKAIRRRKRNANEETFASVLQAGLGNTICRDFYFPYARKIWGSEPEALSAIQAYRRVSNGSLMKMVRQIISTVPGFKLPGVGYYYHPRFGYGQICDAYAAAIRTAGSEIHLGANVLCVDATDKKTKYVRYEQGGQTHCLPADFIWSTIPVTTLASNMTPEPPPKVLQATRSIDFRGMILVYLVLAQERFSRYDAFYFPEASTPVSRISEPKNFTAGEGTKNVTVLCAELPCSVDGPEWEQSDADLGRIVCDSLKAVGMPVQAAVTRVVTKRLPHAYPIYRPGYETHFDQLDTWISGFNGVLTFGRQGLFTHDNLHHALYMGYSAAQCLEPSGCFNMTAWLEYRRQFETHVVED